MLEGALTKVSGTSEAISGSLGTVESLIPGIETQEVVTYALERCSKTDFCFSLRDVKLFRAKASGLISRTSFEVTDLRLNESVGHLKLEKNKQLYILSGADGAEWAKLSVTHPGGNTLLPRQIEFVGASPKGEKIRLKSKKLDVGPNGEKGLFFGGRLVVSSVKNAILIDKESKKECLGIRKIAKNILELDAHQGILPMHAFAAGMAAWLAPT